MRAGIDLAPLCNRMIAYMIKPTTFETHFMPFMASSYFLFSSIHSLATFWANSSLWWLERHIGSGSVEKDVMYSYKSMLTDIWLNTWRDGVIENDGDNTDCQ